MDKRSLLAIVLTFVVLLMWQVLFVSPKQKELTRQRATELREKARTDSLAALERPEKSETLAVARDADTLGGEPADMPRELFSEDAETKAARITVETGTMQVVLTGAGGEIASVTLKEYLKKDGSPVELVPGAAAGGMALSFREGDEWRSLSRAGFDAFIDGERAPDGARVVLGAGRDSTEILFIMTGPSGGSVEKRFIFSPDGYAVKLRITLRRDGTLARTSAYSIGWECGLSSTEKDAKGDLNKFASLGMVGGEYYQTPLGKFGKETKRVHEGTVVWAGARTKYFLSALITAAGNRGTGTLNLLGDRNAGFVGYSIAYPFRGDPRLVEDTFTWYVGPLDMKSLKGYGVGLERTIDLGWLRFLSAGILAFMVWMGRFIPNYGVVIIVLSVLTKLLFYRLTHKSFKSMKDMQRLQPKLKEIQEKFKGDRDRLNKEVMKLYKEAGVSPLGGCLPLLLQMPVFFALYAVLSNVIELRGAPFVGWIDDLSMPDTLFRWGANIPFLGREFHLLPILMGGAMIYQSKLSGSPTGDTIPTAQSKMMTYLMPVFMTVVFYGMPSGLTLYWLVNNVLTILQQYFAQKQIEAEEQTANLAGQMGASGGTALPSGSSAGDSGSADPGKNGKPRDTKSKRRTYH